MDKVIQFFNQPIYWLYSFELWKILLFTFIILILAAVITIIIVKKIKDKKEIESFKPVKSVNVVISSKQENKQETPENAAPANPEESKKDNTEDNMTDEDIYIKPAVRTEPKETKNSSIPKINKKEEFDFDIDEFTKDIETGNEVNKVESKIEELESGVPAGEPRMTEAILDNISRTEDVIRTNELAHIDESKAEIDLNNDLGTITDTEEQHTNQDEGQTEEKNEEKPVISNLDEFDFDGITLPGENKDKLSDIKEIDTESEKDKKGKEILADELDVIDELDIIPQNEIKDEFIIESDNSILKDELIIESEKDNIKDEFAVESEKDNLTDEFDIEPQNNIAHRFTVPDELINNEIVEEADISGSYLTASAPEAKESEEIKEEKTVKGAKAVPQIKVIPKKPRAVREVAATVVEAVKEPEPVKAEIVEKPAKPVRKTAPKTTKDTVVHVPAAAKIKETAASKAAAKTAPVKKEPVKTGNSGKFEIFKSEDKYKFTLLANNGQLLYESLPYASLVNCKNAVNTFKKNVIEGEFIIDKNKNGFYNYILKKGNTVYYGETYNSEKSAKSGIESVKKFSETAVIVLKD